MYVGREKVGASHQGAVDELREAFETVRLLCPDQFVSKLDADRDQMYNWRARIAVIGQVKAGKSTFLSALIGRPQFLPSEVNPWTSVVTNLHFGHPDDPDAGGVFKFFDEQAWEKIINGDVDTRSMAEELLPGFKSEVLTTQVEEMRTRARKRFGQFYEMLLGTEHTYDVVTRATLERYVCAGPEREKTTPEDTLGRYSDITESADIYFPAGAFGTPAILTDTPGVNDPFLVRDEYTCRSLSSSDIFVMTMSAHQALTDVDRGLLKMLAAHSENQVIVFINRIDELEQLETQTRTIVQDVRERLKDIIAENQLTVVAGSAYWAETALNEIPDEAQIEAEAKRPDLLSYLAARGENSDGTPQDILLRASGMPEIIDAMSLAIESGAGRSMRREASYNLLASIDACITIMEGQKTAVEAQLGGSHEDADLSDILQGSLDARSKAVASAKEELDNAFKDGQRDLHKIIENSFNSIHRDLDNVIKDFIEKNRELLMGIFEENGPKKQLELDMLELQDRLETATLSAYQSARTNLDTSLGRLLERVDLIAKPLIGDIGSSDIFENLPNEEVTPVFLATPRVLTLELTSDRGWKFWKSSNISKADAIKKLSRLIRAEIYPSVENLANIGQLGLVERAASAVNHSSSLWTSSLDALSSYASELDAFHAPEDDAATSSGAGSALSDRLGLSLEKLDTGISALKAVKNRIGSLTEELSVGSAK